MTTSARTTGRGARRTIQASSRGTSSGRALPGAALTPFDDAVHRRTRDGLLDRLPRPLLRLEGLALGVAAVVLYVDGDHSWLLFAVLILAPDLSAIGFAAGPRVGALTYDLAHTSAWPVALGVAGVLADSAIAVAVALVWLAHIGVDRALGYGLKYPTHFKDTHLQRV